MRDTIFITAEQEERIKSELKNAGLKRKDLASLFFCDPATVNRMLNSKNDRQGLSLDRLEALADRLGVRKEWLLCEDNYRTEKDWADGTGYIRIEKYTEMIAFLKTMGVSVKVEHPLNSEGQEHFDPDRSHFVITFADGAREITLSIGRARRLFDTFKDSSEILFFSLMKNALGMEFAFQKTVEY